MDDMDLMDGMDSALRIPNPLLLHTRHIVYTFPGAFGHPVFRCPEVIGMKRECGVTPQRLAGAVYGDEIR